MKTQFQVAVSRAIGSKSLLSYGMALNTYEGIVLKANRGCKKSQESLDLMRKFGF